MYRIAKPGIVPSGTTISDPKNKEFFSGISGGTQFSNSQTVGITGTTGSQHVLWVYAEDTNGNCITNCSSVITIK